ncbi:SRPBCC family protein [Ktedonosporobacter rubrisoli]|uniref:SRPBCC family protein n=1 Tax=Ktedonosporobacter rubrisoli TaxID=2509675 RepID=A0A4P6JJI2_KTERU|nr:SRPBCC family protein [Ktedonosporobacter rubrisoli]QBD75275.1 SRPBCC family protein [Ktedonosporobacter rubrisoli]
MPFPTHKTSNAADGIVETKNGSHVLRFERYLPHSIEQVWAALTEPEQLVAWLAEADVEPSKGGLVQLRWLNTDEQGKHAVMNAAITQFDPPRLLEYAGDIHGVLRFELQEAAGGCILAFSSTLPAPNTHLALQLAGWHSHLDFLAEALDGKAVDWPHWPLDLWQKHYDRYSQGQKDV